MKKLIIALGIVMSVEAQATVYELPSCYSNVPTTCTFNDMTLEMCNKESKKTGAVFLLSQRIYVPGGNKFGTSDGKLTCLVSRVKGSEPAKYQVSISK